MYLYMNYLDLTITPCALTTATFAPLYLHIQVRSFFCILGESHLNRRRV